MTSAKLPLAALYCVFLSSSSAFGAEATVADRSFSSQILHETRNYRVFLPPGYETSGHRYPVVYFFHGWSERHNRPPQGGEGYDEGTSYGGNTIAAFVATHDLI